MNKFWHSILKDHVNLTSKELGIQIADWSYLDNWRSISLPSEGEIEHIKECPCCGEELIELMTTTWAESTIRFIVGVCDNCGYIGYMTQPKSEWFTSYYENSWDQAGRSNIDKPKMSPPKDEGLIYFKRHPELFNFKKPLCEIGCGYGRALNYLSQLGFEKVVGVNFHYARPDFNFSFFGIHGIKPKQFKNQLATLVDQGKYCKSNQRR